MIFLKKKAKPASTFSFLPAASQEDDDGNDAADNDNANAPAVNGVSSTSEAKPIKEVNWQKGLNEARNQMNENIEMKNNGDDEEEDKKQKQTEDENGKQDEENTTFEGLFFFKENDERLKKGISTRFDSFS